MIAPGKIGASDRSLEQDVSHQCKPGWRVMEHDMARGVTGTMVDVENKVPHGNFVAILEPAVGFEDLAWNVIAAAGCLQLIEPEALGFMRSLYRHAKF